jgi:hypothetical protein
MNYSVLAVVVASAYVLSIVVFWELEKDDGIDWVLFPIVEVLYYTI